MISGYEYGAWIPAIRPPIILSFVDLSFTQGTRRIYSTPRCCLSHPECQISVLRLNAKLTLKWAEKIRATVAGDHQVRVFDIGDLGSMSVVGNETVYNTSESCIRVLRCHDARVKRVVTEQSPDLFLTVAEVTHPFIYITL
jgi:hypothetical protein